MSGPDRFPFRTVRCSLIAALLGAAFSAQAGCDETLQAALLTGARSTASALLNAFFDELAAQNQFTPVTVKPLR